MKILIKNIGGLCNKFCNEYVIKHDLLILFRKGGVLPKDISVEGNRLIFTRPLNRTDEGVYECEARNSVGSVKTEVNVLIPGKGQSLYDLCNMALFFYFVSIF